MRAKDPEAHREWLRKTLQQGAWRFALTRGVLGWGLPMFIFFILFSFFVPGSQHITTPGLLVVNAMTCAITGMIMGFYLWKIGVTGPAKKHLGSSNF